MRFDGVDDRVELAPSAALDVLPAAFSVSIWAAAESVTGTRTLVSKDLATGGDGFLAPLMPVTVLERSPGVIRDEIAAWLEARHSSWSASTLEAPPNIETATPRPMACGAAAQD